MSNPNTFRQVGAGKNFLSPTDFIIQVDTSAGEVTLVLPKIATILATYTTIFQYMGIRFSDISNNASINNITIEGFETDKINGQSTIVLSNNGDGGVLTLIGENQWSFEQNTSSGGGSTPVNVTYNELYNKIVNSELLVGQKYRVPYKSVNFLNGWDIANNNPTPIEPSFNPKEIYSDTEEFLIVEAISSYQLNPMCNSEKFSQDIIEYQGYTNKIGVDWQIYTGGNMPDGSLVSDFNLKWDGTNVYFDMPTGYPALFGHYFYLYAEFDGGSYKQDGTFEPLTPVIAECQYSYSINKNMSRLSFSSDGMKVILLDLTETDYLNYSPTTLYVQFVYAIGDAYGWITRRNDTQRNINVPFDFRGRKYRRYEVDLSSINPALGLGYYGIGDDFQGLGTTGNYIDFRSFDGEDSDSYDINWQGMGGADMYYYTGYCDNNVIVSDFYRIGMQDYTFNNTMAGFFVDNYVGSNFNNNTINSQCFGNNIYANFLYNFIGLYFDNNCIGIGFVSNKIYDYFTENSIGNNFNGNICGNDFFYNKIGNGFGQNIIGASFEYNVIGDIFSNNQNIDNGFQFNVIGNRFQSNINIKANFVYNYIQCQIQSTDFNLATYVYGNFNCTIFLDSSGNKKLSYIDNAGVLSANNLPNS